MVEVPAHKYLDVLNWSTAAKYLFVASEYSIRVSKEADIILVFPRGAVNRDADYNMFQCGDKKSDIM